MLTQELKKIADNFILNLGWDLKTFRSRQQSIEENIIKLHQIIEENKIHPQQFRVCWNSTTNETAVFI